MGLCVSHGCFNGKYGKFDRWRVEIARTANIPLNLMVGHYEEAITFGVYDELGIRALLYSPKILDLLPLSWDILKPDTIHLLLNHSDCDGELRWQDCAAIADRLETLLPLITGEDFFERTQKFIAGLRVAAAAQEDVEFG